MAAETFDEAMSEVLKLFPNAMWDESDQTGELIIHTGVKMEQVYARPTGKLVPAEPVDEEEKSV